MIKNILIISSNITGHGHKSITEALCEQFERNPEVKVSVVDGFTLGGEFSLRIGKMYGSVTRNAKELWRLIWDLSSKKPGLICEITELSIRTSLVELIEKIKPELILSVHPNFNTPVLNILNEFNIKIPFITLIADLVNINSLWVDTRANYIICPTEESKKRCLELGVSESRLIVIGFPVRSKFSVPIKESKRFEYSGEKPINCILMSGGEGSGNMSRVARILLANFNTKLTIIAGRNAILKRRLERSLLKIYPGRVEIHGFVENIQDFMLASDIAFTRGSPNTMMEVVACNIPLVITGNLPGQEEGNPGYLLANNLGVVCKEISKLKGIMNELFSNNASKLNNIIESQRSFKSTDAAFEIANFILGIDSELNEDMPNSLIKSKTFSIKHIVNKLTG